MSSSSSRSRNLIVACGVLGPLMLGAYFTAPLFATQLGGVLYAAHPTTVQVVDVGRRYHEVLYAGTWLQATGALLAVIFFLALADMTGQGRSLASKITQLGSAVLLAVVLAEAVTAGLSGLQILWIIAAAITLDGRIHRKRGQRLRPEPAYEQH